MFGSTPTESEAPFRQFTGRVWRRAGQLWRQTSLRAAVILHGENVDPETLAVTLDGERHLIMGIWSQLAVQTAAAPAAADHLVSTAATPSRLRPPIPDAELTSAVE